ncbi:MAG: ATP-binding cassette domain-containing protein, partial [Paracoccaceae bacterium]
MLRLEAVRIKVGEFHLRAGFEVAAGESHAIIGPSGAGKSTLLSAIAGFVVPLEGRMVWDGQVLDGLSPGARPVSVIFQDNNLFGHLSVFQNIALGLQPSLKLSDAEHDQVVQAITRVGLEGLAPRKPAALSGGQQSRVALARILARARPLLLLDEPFGALGPALRGEMLDLVAELVGASGATLLMVTHEPRDALRITSKTILVADGVA